MVFKRAKAMRSRLHDSERHPQRLSSLCRALPVDMLVTALVTPVEMPHHMVYRPRGLLQQNSIDQVLYQKCVFVLTVLKSGHPRSSCWQISGTVENLLPGLPELALTGSVHGRREQGSFHRLSEHWHHLWGFSPHAPVTSLRIFQQHHVDSSTFDIWIGAWRHIDPSSSSWQMGVCSYNQDH